MFLEKTSCKARFWHNGHGQTSFLIFTESNKYFDENNFLKTMQIHLIFVFLQKYK